MFDCYLLPWQQIYHLAFYSIFRTTPEVSSKLYFVEICQVSEKLWLFNHKRAGFWLSNFGFKRSLLSLLREFCSGYDIICVIETWGRSQDDFSDLLETHEAFPCIRSEAENFSGGIIVYINKHILTACARIFSTFKNSVFIKLDKTVFSLE